MLKEGEMGYESLLYRSIQLRSSPMSRWMSFSPGTVCSVTTTRANRHIVGRNASQINAVLSGSCCLSF
jgi:hypothetical protein